MSNRAINRTVRGMTDEELVGQERHLRRDIPAAQCLLSAIKRERIRRRKQARRNVIQPSTQP